MFKYLIFFVGLFVSFCFGTETNWKIKLCYESPELYQINGEQTTVQNESWKDEILEKFSVDPHSLEHLTSIQNWIKKSFKFNRGYGVTIGSITSEEIYASKEIRGCHDIGLIFSSIARQLGYPCIFVETTSIAWSKAYAQGIEQEPQGHVFVEIFLDGKWILFDPSTGFYSINYDYQNPYISMNCYRDEPDGFYVLNKGKDNWDLGIYGLEDLLRIQQSTAISIFKNAN